MLNWKGMGHKTKTFGWSDYQMGLRNCQLYGKLRKIFALDDRGAAISVKGHIWYGLVCNSVLLLVAVLRKDIFIKAKLVAGIMRFRHIPPRFRHLARLAGLCTFNLMKEIIR